MTTDTVAQNVNGSWMDGNNEVYCCMSQSCFVIGFVNSLYGTAFILFPETGGQAIAVHAVPGALIYIAHPSRKTSTQCCLHRPPTSIYSAPPLLTIVLSVKCPSFLSFYLFT